MKGLRRVGSGRPVARAAAAAAEGACRRGAASEASGALAKPVDAVGRVPPIKRTAPKGPRLGPPTASAGGPPVVQAVLVTARAVRRLSTLGLAVVVLAAVVTPLTRAPLLEVAANAPGANLVGGRLGLPGRP